jgi:hypothetical protein
LRREAWLLRAASRHGRTSDRQVITKRRSFVRVILHQGPIFGEILLLS